MGAFDITISHNEDFEITLTDKALVALYETTGNKTRLIIILPGNENIFSTVGNYEIVEDFEHDEFAKKAIAKTNAELVSEKELVSDFL